ncbi:MAG: HAD family hydrolase [Planctomycetota bacterium]|nr:MAG: HAD family hydrolase [Planctomycetota bacterium]
MAASFDESDYRAVVPVPEAPTFLPGTHIEIVRSVSTRRYRHALFDFDGTLSLIREGWPEVMIPMMVEILQETPRAETEEKLREHVTSFVMRLNGKQTIYQMIRLADEVKRRGGTPLDPFEYKAEYLRRLHARIDSRKTALRNGSVSPDDLLVPGARRFLTLLRERGLILHLASGTDEEDVIDECRLLGLEAFFEDRVHGARKEFRRFSKARVIADILEHEHVQGDALLGFGDGYVEIDNVKAAGGTAVAVASDEKHRSGRADPWKRKRLIAVGADLVVPDYREGEALAAFLLGGASTL